MLCVSLSRAVACALVWPLLATALADIQASATTIRELREIRQPHGKARLSPSGRFLAYGVLGEGLWLTNVATGDSREVGGAGAADSDAWSPDGRSLAFVEQKEGAARLVVLDVEANETREIPVESLALGPVQWSPDQKRVYVTTYGEVPASGPPPKDETPSEPNGRLEIWRSEGRPAGFSPHGSSGDPAAQTFPTPPCTVWSVGLSRKDVEPLLFGPSIMRIALSPDGKRLAVMANYREERPGVVQDLTDLYVVDVETRNPLKRDPPKDAVGVFDSHGNPLSPLRPHIRHVHLPEVRWSPNSDCLAFNTSGPLSTGDAFVVDLRGRIDNLTGALPPSDDGKLFSSEFTFKLSGMTQWHPPFWAPDGRSLLAIRDGELWRLPVGEGRARRLTSGRARRLTAIAASPSDVCPYLGDGSLIAFTVDPRSKREGVCRIRLTDGRASPLWEEGAHYARSVHPDLFFTGVDRSGRVVYLKETTSSPADFWVLDPGSPRGRQITRLNPGIDRLQLGEDVRTLRWKSRRGEPLSGLLLLPKGASSAKPLPMIVEVYGGDFPSGGVNQFGAGEPIPHLLPTSRGYAVLLPDIPIRKVGQAYQETGDAVLPALDAAIRTGLIDGNRIGLWGHSFGGYNVNCLITQTNRFRAAVSANGVSDLTSNFLGRSTVGRKLIGSQWPMGGPPWEKPDAYVRNSPVYHLQRVTCPLLLLHGERDDTVPVDQSEEMYRGLAFLGKEVELVRYRRQGHNPTTDEEIAEWWERTLNWYDSYIK